LEFDAVFVADASEENYTTSELDTKLLYVALTRPLHKLYIYYIGERSKLLEDV
jgi:DNA helicase II / ATP-dependent DNA helicase PcrA